MSHDWELLPKHRAGLRLVSVPEALTMASDVLRRSGLGDRLDAVEAGAGGAPRRLPLRALATIQLAVWMRKGGDGVLTSSLEFAAELTPRQRKRLGIKGGVSYRQIEHGNTRLTKLIGEGALGLPHNHPEHINVFTGELSPCPADCPFDPVGPDDAYTRLALAGGATGTITGAFAIDSTDVECWAQIKSFSEVPDCDPDGLPHERVGPPPRRRRPKPGPGVEWPKLGADGRQQHSKDPDARESWRTSKKGKRGDTFVGWDVTLAAATCLRGHHEYIPPLITAVVVRPGGCHKGRAGIDAIDAMTRAGVGVKQVTADRGYTYCTAPTFADQLRRREIEQTVDYHKNQRGRRPGPIPGTMWVDGNLYSTAMPEALIDLPGRPMVSGASKAMEKLMAWAELYEPRTSWRFLPMSKPGPDGQQRFKGPALAGKVRCVNTPRSMRGSGPLTRCVRGERCGCGVTVTVGATDQSRERQTTPYGTRAWVKDYYRREAVESANASLKLHQTILRPGAIRVMGTAKVGLMIGYAAAATNVLLMRSVRARAREPQRTYSPADDDLPPISVKRRGRRPKTTAHGPPDQPGG